jgi:PAS domain S-box-containing protein
MKIKTQFIITMLLFGIILVFMAVSAIITNRQQEKVSEQEKVAASIALGASELSYLANDYLIYRESQQLSRWQSRFASFSSLVASLNVDRPEQQALVRNIQINQQRLKEVFDSTVSAVGVSSANQKAGFDPTSLQVSWSRIAIQSQGLISDASRLSQLLHQQMDHLMDQRTLLIYLMTGMFGVLLLAAYMLTHQRILKSIAALRAGAAVIGSGNLDFRIEEKRKDEIGDLSRAFNRMTADLKTVTASKADLEREIAERKEAEEALRESEARYRTLFEAMTEGFALHEIICDEGGRPCDYRFLDVNPAFERLTGLKRTDLLGRCVREVLPGTESYWIENYGKVALTGEPVRFENFSASLDRWFEVFAYRPAAGRFAVLFTDITARKRTETALLRSREDLDRAQAVGQIGSWRLDVRRNVLTWSDENHRIFGLPKGTPLTYETFLGIVHPDDRPYVDTQWKAGLRGEPYDIEHRIVAGGHVKWVREKAYLEFDNAGELQGGFGITQDITERKRTEEALKKAHDDLEKRVQERTSELTEAVQRLQVEIVQRKQLETSLRESENQVRFFASQCLTAQETERKRIAGELHDSIAASLSAIRLRIERIALEMKQGLRSAESLQDIASQVAGINTDVRRIMADLRPSILDDLGILAALNWFCREYQKTYSHISVEKQTGVEEHELPDSLKTPIFRISQETMNNISKHSKASLIKLSLQKEDGKILLTIQDNGQGFDPETARKGMGLSGIRERAELSGGACSIESAKGAGTTVRCSWPI